MCYLPFSLKSMTLDELEDYLERVRSSLRVTDGIALEEYKRLRRIEEQIIVQISEKSQSIKVLLDRNSSS
jgi:hypothetical protein